MRFSKMLRHGALVLFSLCATANLHAAPDGANDSSPDPVTRLLDERGLIGSVTTRSSELISQVRDRASDLVLSSLNFLGVPYHRGGTSAESGFDCSGFTRYIYENSIGRVLPHRADEQANAPGMVKVARQDLKPGDLVFFNTLRRTFSHVGIYMGDGKFIHSPRVGEKVRVEDMNFSYWARRFTGARRVPELASSSTPPATEVPPTVVLLAPSGGEKNQNFSAYPMTELSSTGPSGIR